MSAPNIPMNDETEILPAPLHEDSFDVVMRGYSRQQVNEYVNRSRERIRDLEERLARAMHDIERARDEAADASQRLEHSEPTYEDLGERLGQILKLAEEEAETKRANATSEAEATRADAATEAERVRAEAEAETERVRADAASEAEQLRASVSTEAEQLRADAAAEADQLRANSRQEAERLVNEAQDQAQEIEERTQERVNLLCEQHNDFERRLVTMRDMLSELLDGSPQSGSGVGMPPHANGGTQPVDADVRGSASTAPDDVPVDEPVQEPAEQTRVSPIRIDAAD